MQFPARLFFLVIHLILEFLDYFLKLLPGQGIGFSLKTIHIQKMNQLVIAVVRGCIQAVAHLQII